VLRGKTTEEVVQIIKTRTKECRGSYLDWMVINDSKQAATKATIFVSHAWNESFLDLVAGIQERFKDPTTSFWIDVFVVPQNDEDKPQGANVWFDGFGSTLAGTKCMVAVLSTYNKPVYVTRAWCLFEFVSAMRLRKQINIILPPGEKARFVAFLVQGGNILDLFGKIDMAHAKASDPIDQRKIRQYAMEGGGGCDAVNGLVFEGMRDWAVSVAHEEYDRMPRAERSGGPLQCALGNLLYRIGR
jgi:hypothetical protein